MFDMNNLNRRYWDVKFSDGTELSIEPPKLKTLRKITNLTKDEENIVENLCIALSMALSKNKQNKKVSAEFIEDNFDMDQISLLLTNYFEWVKGEKQNPN